MRGPAFFRIEPGAGPVRATADRYAAGAVMLRSNGPAHHLPGRTTRRRATASYASCVASVNAYCVARGRARVSIGKDSRLAGFDPGDPRGPGHLLVAQCRLARGFQIVAASLTPGLQFADHDVAILQADHAQLA